MKQIDLVNLTGIGKSSISTYISGEYEPKQRNIYKIARALNINEAWLMGYDVPMERSELVEEIDEPNDILIKAKKILNDLPPNLQEAALAQLQILEGLSKKPKND